MEAEKFLSEQENENPIETDSEVKKGKEETNGDVPEYRSNPLL